MRSGMVTLLVIALAIAVSIGGAISYLSIPQTPSRTQQCAGAPATVHFTIIESDTGPNKGMNGSAYHQFYETWPALNVCLGQKVTITITNQNSSETHGLAIDNYVSGILISPGQTRTVTFVANQVGSFWVHCDAPCLIHATMLKGRMYVNN